MIGALLFSEEQTTQFKAEFGGSAAPSFDTNYVKETWDYVYDIGGKLDLGNMHEEFTGALRNWRVRDMIFRCVWDYPVRNFLPKIECPTLLMCAPDDVLYPGHQNTAATMPQAKAIEVKGMDMEPNLDPKGVSQGIKDFLSENNLE
jgi:pimeloyl-ACP methyl ester carboxylesterase